jgi:CubicO group peptidase (beta-lactamase class C family)
VALRSILLAGLLCAVAVAPAAAAPKLLDPDHLGPAVDSIATEAMSKGPIAGVSIAISRGGILLFDRAYGFADLEAKRAVLSSTPFPLCSISKHIAAAAILTLVEQGRLQLDTRLDSLLTDMPQPWQGFTVRQLLTHTSGLLSYNELPNWDSLATRPLSHAEVLALVGAPPPAFAPGSRWRYSNTGYYLLGMIVERVTGREYWSYLREEVISPRMRPTAGIPLSERAHGYRESDSGLVSAEREHWANPFAGGGLAASAADLVSWEDELQEGHLLGRASVTQMMSPTKLGYGQQIHYGLGTRLGTLEGHRVVGHTGNGNGFNHVLAHYPSDRITIAVLTNSESRVGARAIEAAIARRVLGLGPYKYLDTAVPPAIAGAVEGKWTDGLDQWTVVRSGDRLRFQPSSGEERPLPYRGGNAFGLGPEFEVRFVMDVDKKKKKKAPSRATVSETFRAGLFEDAQFRP